MCTELTNMNMDLKNSECKEADLSTNVLRSSDFSVPHNPMAIMYSCIGCSLHKDTGSELVRAEIQARLHSLSMDLHGCVFPEGCLLLILTNVPYGPAQALQQLPEPCSAPLGPPATRVFVLGLRG